MLLLGVPDGFKQFKLSMSVCTMFVIVQCFTRLMPLKTASKLAFPILIVRHRTSADSFDGIAGGIGRRTGQGEGAARRPIPHLGA